MNNAITYIYYTIVYFLCGIGIGCILNLFLKIES